ncbi:MAG: hypothetical protein C0616_02780 [Desulfuromonas sp.]|nr:MAG: hypothetical protein C0616_02780 [Desulfuromonas sp.]
MRSRTFHCDGFIPVHNKSSHLLADNSLFRRCCHHMLKNILPTLVMLVVSSAITLAIASWINQAKSHQAVSDPGPFGHGLAGPGFVLKQSLQTNIGRN